MLSLSVFIAKAGATDRQPDGGFSPQAGAEKS